MPFGFLGGLQFVFFLFLAISQAAFALSSDPTRMLSGRRLAFRVAEGVFERQGLPPVVVRSPPGSPSYVVGRLYAGLAFRPLNSQERFDLENWILSHDDFSVEPLALTLKAIEITQGDLGAALTLCWDVLRSGWRDTRKRNLFERTLKLKDITGEQIHFDGNIYFVVGKRVNTTRGDNFSAWYHFFGTAVSSFYFRTKLPLGLGAPATDILIEAEERFIHNEFIDGDKRIENDREGSIFGAELARVFRRYKNLSELQQDKSYQKFHSKNYVVSDSRFQQNWKLRPGQHPIDFGSNDPRNLKTPLMKRLILMRKAASKMDSRSIAYLNRVASQSQRPELRGMAIYYLSRSAASEEVDNILRRLSYTSFHHFTQAGLLRRMKNVADFDAYIEDHLLDREIKDHVLEIYIGNLDGLPLTHASAKLFIKAFAVNESSPGPEKESLVEASLSIAMRAPNYNDPDFAYFREAVENEIETARRRESALGQRNVWVGTSAMLLAAAGGSAVCAGILATIFKYLVPAHP